MWLRALLIVSISVVLYTYLLYPVIIYILPGKKYLESRINPFVSIIVLGSDGVTDEKRISIKSCRYSRYEVIETNNINDAVERANGEVIILTDSHTCFDKDAISEIVSPFSDVRVSGVVGQQTSVNGNSLIWEYENFVREQESKFGCVSGANSTLFAIRKRDMPVVPDGVLNIPFYVLMKLIENKHDVVFQKSAKALERKNEKATFLKQKRTAEGYWQAFRIFWRMLLPKKGSLIYISHRVLKWFIWLNMLACLCICGLGAHKSKMLFILFLLQVIFYMIISCINILKIEEKCGRILMIANYFVVLNVATLVGMFGGHNEERFIYVEDD